MKHIVLYKWAGFFFCIKTIIIANIWLFKIAVLKKISFKWRRIKQGNDLHLFKSLRDRWPLFFLYFLHWSFLWQRESRVFWVNALLCLAPWKDSETSSNWIVQKAAMTGRPTGSRQRWAPAAHMRWSMSCGNTNTSELLKLCFWSAGNLCLAVIQSENYVFLWKERAGSNSAFIRR